MATVKLLRRLGCRRGAELIEMALVLPLLLVLLAGIVDFAFLFQSYEVVTNAAREGARIAVLPGYGSAGVIQGRVAAYVAASGLAGTPTTSVSNVTVSPGGGAPAFPAVQVSVDYTHQFVILGPMMTLIGGSFMNSLTFTASSTMRRELVFGGP